MPISVDLQFRPLNIGVLTVSDTRDASSDRSGGCLAALLEESGHRLAGRFWVRDEQHEIVERFCAVRDDPNFEVLLVTGGTGITARDVTPEAFAEIVEKPLPGFGEIFRVESFRKIGTSALQSRAMAGIAGRTVFFILPGSPSACRDAWGLISEMLDSRFRPCNLVEMLPRL